MSVGQIIWSQIKAGSSNQSQIMSWGVRGLLTSDKDGWLRFKVSGLKFKGYVRVTLDRVSDTYIIEFFKIRKDKVKIHQTYKDVYCDMLFELIDEYVEKVEAYKF